MFVIISYFSNTKAYMEKNYKFVKKSIISETNVEVLIDEFERLGPSD